MAYALSIGTKVIDLGWPYASFGAHCTNLNEDRPILSATEMSANDSSFWKYKVYGDICGGSSWRGRQMRVGLTTKAIFGDLRGYFFRIYRDKASSIIWRHATPCWPVTDCKMNDLEWPCVFGQHFLNHSVWMSEIVQPLRFCGVLCIARSVSQPR